MKTLPIIFTFTFLLSVTSLIHGQGNWETKSDMPTARKEIADAATLLDGNIYVMGGTNSSGSITNVFERYDPDTDSWTTLAPYPINVWRASLEAFNGKIYGMGGYESLDPFPFSPTNKAFVYDPGTDSWSPVQDMLAARGSAATVILNGEIHLIGGANTSALDTHHSYDPGSDAWTAVSTLNTGRSGLTAAVIGGKVIAAGGYFLSSGVVSLDTAEIYDPGTGAWTFVSDLPFTKLGISSAVVQDRMYVFGNENGTAVLEYDPVSDDWSELASMPENVNFSGAVAHNNRIYVMGGGEVNLATDGIAAMNCFEPELLGVDSTLEGKMLQLYPNPSSGTLFIKSEHKVVSWRLFDHSGRLMDHVENDSEEIINNSIELTIPNGIYLLSLQFENGTNVNRKVVVTR